MTDNEKLDKWYAAEKQKIEKKHFNPATKKPYNQEAYNSAIEQLERNMLAREKSNNDITRQTHWWGGKQEH
ncbi:MAG: hypothetical protein LBJ18_02200 [Rickettsiales bacterium]|jgi:hypothetical protein|nr:hypothetical protein [Rickettsiales bacterium]